MPIIGLSLFESTTRRYDVIKSVFDYAVAAPDWTVVPMPIAEHAWLTQVSQVPFDGMITCLDFASDAIEAACRSFSVPIVDVGTRPSSFSSVRVHPSPLGELAYSQLSPAHRAHVVIASVYPDTSLRSSLQQLCLNGQSHMEEIELRLSHSELNSFSPRPNQQVRDWLRALPVAGIVTTCDLLAVYLLLAAKQLEIDVPSQLSIVSARDSLVCGLPSISMTSVVEPTREIGFQAARLLDQQIRDRKASPTSLLVPASEVIRRGTTVQLDYDISIARALHFIEQNALRPISVPSVLDHQAVSRVTFERRFKEAVGCAPGEYIRREKLRRIKERLVATAEPISKIARDCGFSSAARFSSFFKNAEGVTPKQFQIANQREPICSESHRF